MKIRTEKITTYVVSNVFSNNNYYLRNYYEVKQRRPANLNGDPLAAHFIHFIKTTKILYTFLEPTLIIQLPMMDFQLKVVEKIALIKEGS